MDRINRQNIQDNDEIRRKDDIDFEGREKYDVDIDRMINEGLGGGYISDQNGYIGDTTVDEM